MKSRGVIGKKIIAIRQGQFVDRTHGRIVEVDAIVLEDGTELRPLASEIEDGDRYPVDFIVIKPPPKPIKSRIKLLWARKTEAHLVSEFHGKPLEIKQSSKTGIWGLVYDGELAADGFTTCDKAKDYADQWANGR